MPTTTDSNDRETTKRLATLFRTNPEFAKDYFANPPRSDSSPSGKNNYARHAEAVAHVATLLQQEEAAAQYRAGLGFQPDASRVGVEREIRELQDSPLTVTPATRITAPRWTGFPTSTGV